MRAIMRNRNVRALLVLAAGMTALGVAPTPASAANVTINLCAKPGTATMADGASVDIWGFGEPATPGNCSTASAGLPGPVYTVDEGASVTINVINALPDPASATAPQHRVSLEVTGMSFTGSSTEEAAVGDTASVTFTANKPGTYLYESVGDGGRQTAMGMYGALIVRSLTVGQAYDDASGASAYDVQSTLVLSQIDPAFNAAPDSFNLNEYVAQYWLINGASYPGTAPITATSGQRVLLRYVNAGYDNTTMSLIGMHQTVVARDSYLLNNLLVTDADTLPAGATEDAVAVMPGFAAPTSHGFPLFNRQLHLTNGPQSGTSPTPATGGGMLTFIRPPAGP